MSLHSGTSRPGRVQDLAALEQAVGARPKASTMKSIDILDRHCLNLLEHATLIVVGYAEAGRARMRTCGAAPGGFSAASAHVLALPGLDGSQVTDSAPAAALVLVPGLGETLRINGRLRREGEAVVLDVEEAFIHCAKALLRSNLWTPAPVEPLPADLDAWDFLAAAPFVTVWSTDSTGAADLSPKGDPAGFVQVLDAETVAIPDRPGNRRTDTMHNLLEDDRVGLLAFVPGDDRVLEMHGCAHITTDPEVLAPMEVKGHHPSAALLLELVGDPELRHDAGLIRSQLWDPARHIEAGALPRASVMWADHVKHGQAHGLQRLGKLLINERLLAMGVEHDYRSKMY